MVQIEVFDPGMVVRESLKMLDRLLGEDIDLQYFAALEIGKLRGDPGQFEQILMNLVVNARDAMPQGGPIHVTLDRRRLQDEHRQGDYIRLCVKDGGIGIPPEVRDKLFEPFFTTKPQGRGTGLGLATVYGIVQQFHGFIEFESEVGRGSVFQVYFPRYPDPNEPAASDLRGKTASTTGSETILLVEDDTAVRALTQSLLTRAGYRVLAAESAEAALALFEELPEPPNIVVTDVVMPGMSGKALADAITLRHPGMKFLFLSGYTNDRTFAYGLNRETSAFLQKPVSPGELGRAVRRLLDDQN
jgi:CheY-like chemotaxis protein